MNIFISHVKKTQGKRKPASIRHNYRKRVLRYHGGSLSFRLVVIVIFSSPLYNLLYCRFVFFKSSGLFELPPNVFTEVSEFSDKIFVIAVKGFKPASSCVRDQDTAIVPAGHMWETGSLNWLHFMLLWIIRFPEFHWFSLPFRENSIIRSIIWLLWLWFMSDCELR